MAALAYVLLPLSGLVALLTGGEARTRFHGIQAIVFGSAWAGALWVASWLGAGVTQVVFVAGAALWLVLLIGTAFGRDPTLPGLGRSQRGR